MKILAIFLVLLLTLPCDASITNDPPTCVEDCECDSGGCAMTSYEKDCECDGGNCEMPACAKDCDCDGGNCEMPAC